MAAPRAYYNEVEPYAAGWIRNLISAGLVPAGDVDERDIRDVPADDLAGYAQCHFFAGVGVWAYALRNAGWPDDRPVWTGSCPCQPFSSAGGRGGFADERHLWPAFHWLIQQRRPAIVFGEQVASRDADPWIDLVQDDLEALGYALGAVPFPASGVGAPHIRDRLYWVADVERERWQRRGAGEARTGTEALQPAAGLRHACLLADASHVRRREGGADTRGQLAGDRAEGFAAGSMPGGADGGLADPNGRDAGAEREQCGWEQRQQPAHGGIGHNQPAGPTDGFWRDADWLRCRDGRWRPVEPGTFPLAHGAPGRVGRLRAYGNAIVAPQAEAFIRAYCESGDLS